MNSPQSAILPAAGPHALFITADIGDSGDHRLSDVVNLTEEMVAAYPNANLHSALGIGPGAWKRLIGTDTPKGLRDFADFEASEFDAPSTPSDLFIHIHSDRADLNYELGRRLLTALGPTLEIREEIAGYRYLDNRDMTGFVDGTENPEGDDRADVALLADGHLAAGSFVSIQRYVHGLSDWENLAVHDQEKIIGRTKQDDVEMRGENKPSTAHISRVVIKDDGVEQEIVRHSMPYGTPSESGLYFVAYCANPETFQRMLRRMHGLGGDAPPEVHDHLLRYTRAVTGAMYFVPSRELLAVTT